MSGDVSINAPTFAVQILIGLFCSWECAFDDKGVRMALNGRAFLQGLCFLVLSTMVDAQGKRRLPILGGPVNEWIPW